MKDVYVPFVDFNDKPGEVLNTKQVERNLKIMEKPISKKARMYSLFPKLVVTVNENGKMLLKAFLEQNPESVLRNWDHQHIEIDNELNIRYSGSGLSVTCSVDEALVVIVTGVINSGREVAAVQQFIKKMNEHYHDLQFYTLAWVHNVMSLVDPSQIYAVHTCATGRAWVSPNCYWTSYGLNIKRCPDEANGGLYAYRIAYGYAPDLEFKEEDGNGIIKNAVRR